MGTPTVPLETSLFSRLTAPPDLGYFGEAPVGPMKGPTVDSPKNP